MDQHNGSGDGKKWTNSRYNLETEQSWSIDELNMRDEHEGKGEIKENPGFGAWEDEHLYNVVHYNTVVKMPNFSH